MNNKNSFTFYHPELKRRSSLRNLLGPDGNTEEQEDFFAVVTALSKERLPQEEVEDFVPFMMMQEPNYGANRGDSPSTSAIAEDSLSSINIDLLQNHEDGSVNGCDHVGLGLGNKQNDQGGRFLIKADDSATEGKEPLAYIESRSACKHIVHDPTNAPDTDTLAKELKDLATPNSSSDGTSGGQINRKRLSPQDEDYEQESLAINTKRLRLESKSTLSNKNDVYRGEGRRPSADCDHLDIFSSKKDLSVAILNAQQYHREAQVVTAGENKTLPPGASTSLVSFHYYGANGIPPPQTYQISTAAATSTASNTTTEPCSQTSIDSKGTDGQQGLPQSSEHSLILSHHQKQPSSRSISDTSHKNYVTTSNSPPCSSSAFTSLKKTTPTICNSQQHNPGDYQEVGTDLQDQQGYDTLVEDSRSSYNNTNGQHHELPFQHASKKESMPDHDHNAAPAPYSYFADEKVPAGNTGLPSVNSRNTNGTRNHGTSDA